MTAPDALRFLDHEAQVCRDRDTHEALCLLLPALLKLLELEPMTCFEASAFRNEFRDALRNSDNQKKAAQVTRGKQL